MLAAQVEAHGDRTLRQRHHDALPGGQVDLGSLGALEQVLSGVRIHAQIRLVLRQELLGHVVDQTLIDVDAAQVGIAIGGEHREFVAVHPEDGDVERPAPEVVDQQVLLRGVLAKAIRQRGGGGFVDDRDDFEARDLAGDLGCAALGVLEVRRDADDRFVNLLAERGFGVARATS